TVGGCDGDALVDGGIGEGEASRHGDDLTDRALGKNADVVEAGEDVPLVPHGGEHVGREDDVEERAAELCVDAGYAFCVLAVAFAEGDVAELGELEHATVDVDVAVDAAGAADDALGAEACVEHVELAHAVEQREDCGLGADGGREVVDRLFERVGLDSEDDEVERLRLGAEFAGCDEFCLDGGVAERADDFESVAAQFFGARGADEEGDVAADLCETAAEESAGGAGADNKSAHEEMVAKDRDQGSGIRKNRYKDPSTTRHFVTLRSG